MPTFDTPEPIAVYLELGVGDVRIAASDRRDTVVAVRPSDPARQGDVAAADGTRVEYASGRLLIKAPGGWRQWAPWRGGESIDVEVALPSGSQVYGEAAIAALRCTGCLGECRYQTSLGDIELDQSGPLHVKTSGGNITVEKATDRIELSTGVGAMRVAGIHGSAAIKNSNGDTWVGEVTGDLRVNAANGRISVERAEASVVAKTANGDVRVGELIGGTVLAESGNGRIEVGVRDGVAAWLDLNTRRGAVRCDLDSTRGPEVDQDTVEVRAYTSFGDITISRRLLAANRREERS